MKLKLDENIGDAGVAILSAAGHDVSTVREQQLLGIRDEVLLQVCAAEGRSLITLDRGLGRQLRLSTAATIGVVVLDIGVPQSHRTLTERLRQFSTLLEDHDLSGAIWILEAHRARMHSPTRD